MPDAGGYPGFNLPDDYTQAALDAYWGKPVSGAVSDAIDEHRAIQHLRMQLAQKIKACSDQTVADHYEDLLASCEDHEFSDEWMQGQLEQAEKDNAEAARQDHYEMARGDV